MFDVFELNAIFENSVIIEKIKLTFFSENKFYDRKESSLTNWPNVIA